MTTRIEVAPSSRIQREMAEQLIALFSFNHPQIYTNHLERLFYAWNVTDQADDGDMREAMQFSLQMMKDFFFIFAKEDPETVAKALKNLSNLIEQSHETAVS